MPINGFNIITVVYYLCTTIPLCSIAIVLSRGEGKEYPGKILHDRVIVPAFLYILSICIYFNLVAIVMERGSRKAKELNLTGLHLAISFAVAPLPGLAHLCTQILYQTKWRQLEMNSPPIWTLTISWIITIVQTLLALLCFVISCFGLSVEIRDYRKAVAPRILHSRNIKKCMEMINTSQGLVLYRRLYSAFESRKSRPRLDSYQMAYLLHYHTRDRREYEKGRCIPAIASCKAMNMQKVNQAMSLRKDEEAIKIEEKTGDIECNICNAPILDTRVTNEMSRRFKAYNISLFEFPSCRHIFHLQCAYARLQENTQCSICGSDCYNQCGN